MLNQEMQNAVNATMNAEWVQQETTQEAVNLETEQTEVDNNVVETNTEAQVVEEQQAQEVQTFDPNGWNAPLETEAENIAVTPDQDVTTATEDKPEEQWFSRDDELNELEAMLKWTAQEEVQEEPQQQETESNEMSDEPESEEENLNYKVKWKEVTTKNAQLEAENYRLTQQLKYANLELEDSANRYGTLKDRQIELNNDIESLRNKVTHDDLADLSDKYRIWKNVENDATSVQLVQTICWLLTEVTWKNAEWIFEDYLATRTNKDIPFISSHSDNTSATFGGNQWVSRISL